MFARVVVNCGAGSVDDDEQQEQRTEITAAFEAAGATCEIAFVPGADLEQAITEAAGAAPDVVVVAGGDGSLGTAALVLAGGDVPLGILPLGTFNHFAKDLAIPLTIGEAAAAIVDGEPTRVDVGEVNGRCFVNNSSIGVYPVMVALRDEIRDRRGWGKFRAVPVATWRVLHRFPARRITITADGYQASLRTPFVFIGNNRYDIGPGALSTRETIAGGELWVYVARAASRLRLVTLAFAAAIRGVSNMADLDQHGAPEITIEAHSHHLRVAIDGEVVTLRAPLKYRVRPGALTVLTPTAMPVPTGEVPADASGADAEPQPK